MNPAFKEYLLKVTSARDCREIEVIQSLWSGYGKISRIQLEGSGMETVVVKNILLNSSNGHPRGWDSANSHNRKIKSYEVETYWYKEWNEHCNASCKTPSFLGSFSLYGDKWIILEDLDTEFPHRKTQLKFSEVKVSLKWLANFHATFLDKEPKGLWEIGTYWHLKTRPDELKKIEFQELKLKAGLMDQKLNNCKYRTFVHGDAKLANFCFSADGTAVAAVDFQYVGGGCGMKDVAYFLGSCLSSEECEIYEEELLAYYFSELEASINVTSVKVDYKELQSEWEIMYPLACADFMRFMLGWMPTHQKIDSYNLRILNSVLKNF